MAKGNEGKSKLHIVPCTLGEAQQFIKERHRHHQPPKTTRFAVAVANDSGEIVGVATMANPVARLADDGWTLEVNRCCTDGTPNACSALYGACWRAAKALGYKKLITYTLPEEGGSSLKGSGWKCLGEAGGGSWNRPNCGRPRVDKAPTQLKLKWEASLEGE